MPLDHLPIFRDLDDAARAALHATAAPRHLDPGEVLCYPGDPAATLHVLTRGRLALEQDGEPLDDLLPPAPVDLPAVLGGLPHRVKAAAVEACHLLAWPVDRLWGSPEFAAAARRHLAQTLIAAQARLDALEAPLHYTDAGGTLAPGPFVFEDVTLIFAFCETNLDGGAMNGVRALLPPGLTLWRRPWRQRDSVLIALASFPDAHPEDDPAARFGYTETTIFVPVRHRRRFGLFVPYIYPSTWEPIRLGREIYGFPKRLGRTTFGSREAALHVDGAAHLALSWAGLDASDEVRLVRALMDWLGLEGRSLSLAFQAGDALRRVMQLPPFRQVTVYNHKRSLAADATRDAPTWAVDQLTEARFGVLRWYQIARMQQPVLAVMAGPLAEAGVTLREAYRTQLALRLSTGRVVRDYVRNE